MAPPRIAPTQADAIVQAVMAPDLDARAERAQRCANEALGSARKRRIAAGALAGQALGAALYAPLEVRFAAAMLWGGLLGAGVSWIMSGLLTQRPRKPR